MDTLEILDSPGCCGLPSVRMIPDALAERLASAYKAMGHPIRLQMMNILAQAGGQVCVCEIEPQFDVKQPTISHHLRTLRHAGLVDVEQRGLYAFYRVNPDALTLVRRYFEQISH